MGLYKYNTRRWILLRFCKIFMIISIFLCFALGGAIMNKYKTPTSIKTNVVFPTVETTMSDTDLKRHNMKPTKRTLISTSELHMQLIQEKIERLEKKFKKSRSIVLSGKSQFPLNNHVHVFYYGWYGNKEIDGNYKHWNHSFLPNWKRNAQKSYPTGSHEPITDIGSNYYPALGCYSSKDPNVIEMHMKQLKEAGVGVLVISWTPPVFKDSPNELLPKLFKFGEKYKIKIALHIEPYTDRNPLNLFEHFRVFLSQYEHHPALYKIPKESSKKRVPLVYVYDSYLTPAVAWKELLNPKGNLSIRGSDIDAVFIGLLVDIKHRYHIKKSHFDGFYTYFAANSFSYGSTWKNWRSLSKFAIQNGLIFIPSVGPGYVDTQVRPWNTQNTRHRRHGQYYDVAWRTAINSNANYISITSFNEWHEGTQIEPAMPKSTSQFTYLDYEPDGAQFYLNLTKWWVEQFTKTLAKT